LFAGLRAGREPKQKNIFFTNRRQTSKLKKNLRKTHRKRSRTVFCLPSGEIAEVQNYLIITNQTAIYNNRSFSISRHAAISFYVVEETSSRSREMEGKDR
jgi:hypothetical protein